MKVTETRQRKPQQKMKNLTLSALMAATSLALACQNDAESSSSTVAGANQTPSESSFQEEVIKLSPATCKVATPPVPEGAIPSPAVVAKDAYCARQMMRQYAPHGAVTIFGSARTPAGHQNYEITRVFAYKWTEKQGKKYPIMTGGGGGIMEAGNRGAKEAKGESLSIATHFIGKGLERPNSYTTQSYMAGSFSQRETDLVDYSAAIVIAPGGFGTEWEIFESLSKIQTAKKHPVPFVLLGPKSLWTELLVRIEKMRTMGTISPHDVQLIKLAETPDDAVSVISSALNIGGEPAPAH